MVLYDYAFVYKMFVLLAYRTIHSHSTCVFFKKLTCDIIFIWPVSSDNELPVIHTIRKNASTETFKSVSGFQVILIHRDAWRSTLRPILPLYTSRKRANFVKFIDD